jgi:hypothetical protein
MSATTYKRKSRRSKEYVANPIFSDLSYVVYLNTVFTLVDRSHVLYLAVFDASRVIECSICDNAVLSISHHRMCGSSRFASSISHICTYVHGFAEAHRRVCAERSSPS